MLFTDNQLLTLVGFLCFCVSTRHLGDDLKIKVKCRGLWMLIFGPVMNTVALGYI